jgi:hypothetical protein
VEEGYVCYVYEPVTCPDGLGKTSKNFSKSNRCPSRDSNRSPPEYGSEVIQLETTGSRNVRWTRSWARSLYIQLQHLTSKESRYSPAPATPTLIMPLSLCAALSAYSSSVTPASANPNIYTSKSLPDMKKTAFTFSVGYSLTLIAFRLHSVRS